MNTKRFDVAVLGGGFAGVAAALAAARGGANVLLVEKGNCLGGAAVHCLVNPFMRYWTTMDGKRVDLADGLFREINERLQKRTVLDEKVRFLEKEMYFHEEELKYVMNEMVTEAGVTLLYHAHLFRAEREADRVTAVSLATRGGELRIEADYFIDATGDAQLAYLAGCPTTLGREPDHLCQPMTLCFRVGNVDVGRFMASRPTWAKAHAESLAAGELSNPRENILVFYSPLPGVLHFNTTRVIKKNPTDPFDLTEAEILARAQVYEIYELLKKHADGLENSFLMMTAPEIGVRESRMIRGDYTLTESDCKGFARFEDAIAACNYDIDIHNPEGTGTYIYAFGPGEYYTIPYRCLVPKNSQNLLVAGRCISSDHDAQASYRVIPYAAALGEAAGVAAALSLEQDTTVKDVNVEALLAQLRKQGAFVEKEIKRPYRVARVRTF